MVCDRKLKKKNRNRKLKEINNYLIIQINKNKHGYNVP